MKKNSALLTAIMAMLLVLSLGLVACGDNDKPAGETTYAVTLPSGEGYTVVGETTVRAGGNYSFSVNIADGYNDDNMVVRVNGDTVTKSGNTFTVNSVSGNLVITVTGVQKNAPGSYSVKLPEGNGFSASGNTTVTAGEDYTFTVTVASGYNIDTLVVKNGETTLTAVSKEGNVVTYSIAGVESDIRLTATIAKVRYNVTLPAAADQVGYAIVGAGEVEHGENYTFTVTAVAGYSAKNAIVKNGETVLTGVDGAYTVENVTGDIVITVTGVEKLYDYITVTKKTYDLKLSAVTDAEKASAYYMTGVSGYYQSAACEVEADLTAVNFTKAGTYTITYRLVGHETVSETATVNIYGTPVITVAQDAVKSTSWSADLDLNAFIETLKSKIGAKDSLNADLAVAVKTASIPAKNIYGFYDIKTYDVTFTAEDKMGNSAEEIVQITVRGGTNVPSIPGVTIDLGNTDVKVTEYEVGVDFLLYEYVPGTGLVAVTNAQAAFDAAKDGTYFAASYLGSLALGEHTYVAVLEDAFVVITLTLTDNGVPAFTVPVETELAYLVGETFVLPTAVKDANSAQAITVRYFLGDAEFTGNPTLEGSYTYSIRFYRGETELTESRKTYTLRLVKNIGWSGANVGALSNGHIYLEGTNLTGDTNPFLSADYITANKGENNVVVITVKLLDAGTNAEASLWYLNGVAYITEAGKPETYIGKNLSGDVTLTMKLRIEENGTSTFILRNFDGKVEVTDISFETFTPYVEDPNFTKGYAERVNLTYDDDGNYVTDVEVAIPADVLWYTDTPAFSAEYIKKLYAAGKRYMALTPQYSSATGGFLYAYVDAEGTSHELFDIANGGTKIITFADNSAIRFSKVDIGGGQGLTLADTIHLTVAYYTEAEYAAIQDELAKAEARRSLDGMTKSLADFWTYFHVGAFGDNNVWGEDNRLVYVTSRNIMMQKQLIDDAKTAGYRYLLLRVKATSTTASPVDHICFTSNPSALYYWNQYSGDEVVLRLDLSKYYNDYTFDGTTVLNIVGRDASANELDCNYEVELLAFEEPNDKYFVSIEKNAAYTVTGDRYAILGAGESKSFTITAADGYTIDKVECEGATITSDGNVYTVSGVTKDAKIIVTASKITEA